MPENFLSITLCHRHSTLPSQTREDLHQLWALPWHKTFFFFFFCECLGIQFFNSLTCGLRETMPRQRSLTLFTHMWLMGHYAMPEVTQLFSPPNPFYPECYGFESIFYSQVFFTLHSLYLGKRRISLGVIGILSMYLRLHT